MTDVGRDRKLAPSGIVIPFTTFGMIGILCILVFCSVRTVFHDVYAPRRGLGRCRPPRIPKSFFGWISHIYTVPEVFLVYTVGLDGVMLLRFFRMGISFFLILSIFGLGILVPVNYAADKAKQNLPGGIFDEIKILRQLTVENVPQQSPFLKIHLFFTWIFSFIAYYHIIRFYQKFVQLKLQYQEYLMRKSNLGKIDMRSIMVYGIPRELRDEVDLALYFESLNIGKVESTVICRRFSQLRNSVAKRAYFLCKLETLYAQLLAEHQGQNRRFSIWKWKIFRQNSIHAPEDEEVLLTPSYPLDNDSEKNIMELFNAINQIVGNRPIIKRLGLFGLFGPKVNILDFYISQFWKWDKKVLYLRRSPEISPPTSVGFVTFESPESAAIASQINIASKPFMLMTRMAPEPRDLYWPNISSSTADPLMKLIRSTTVYLCMFFMIFFSTLAVSAIASLIDLESLARIIPGLKEIIENMNPVVRQFIQGVIPTVVLALWTSSLPSLLLLLSEFQGLEALSWIEMSVLSKYFFYQLWNILLIVVSSTIFKSTAWPIQSPKDIIEILGNSLPQESPTLINYAMLQALAAYPAQLLLAGPLILTWLTRLAPWSKGSPRQVSDAYYPSTLTSINYGIAYSVPMLIWVIGLIYAPIAPLILPFCTVFFAVGYMVYKYMLLYVHIPQYETGGMHIPMAIRRLLAGMIIMQLTMMGVLALKNIPARERTESTFHLFDKKTGSWSGYVYMVLAVSPLLVLTIAVFWWFRYGYEREVEHTPMDLLGKVGRALERKQSKPAVPNARPSTISSDIKGVRSLADDFISAANVTGLVSSSSITHASATTARELQEFANESRHNYSLFDEQNQVNPLNNQSNLPGSKHRMQRRVMSLRGSVKERFHSDEALIRQESEPTMLETTSSTMPSPRTLPEDKLLSTNMINEGLDDEEREFDDDNMQSSEIFDNSVLAGRSHLEPPMTKVPGVLDAPLESSVPVLPDMDEQEIQALGNAESSRREEIHDVDLQVHTYLHPALVGRLPQAWLSGISQTQPESLLQAREDQIYAQIDTWRRVVGKQRLGMRAAEQDLNDNLSEYEDEEEESDGGGRIYGEPYPISPDGSNLFESNAFTQRRRSPTRRSLTARIRSFIEGVTSWAHLQMS